MTTSNLNIRLDDDLRSQATQILADYGLSPTQAVKLFFNQVVRTQKIPLRFDYKEKELIPNDETRLAMLEARQDYLAGKLDSYDDVDSAVQAMTELAHD